MPTTDKSTSAWVWICCVALVIVLVAIAFLWAGRPDPRGEQSTDSIAPLHRAGDPASPSEEVVGRSAPEPEGAAELSLFDRDFDIAMRWARVDLDAVRAAMPDNLYWELSAPTSDPVILEERADERARWNEEYGKVLSGNATEAEIEAYYAQRHRLSADYVEFGSHLLERYGDVLPARDVGLLELSVKMHHARLQQMPRRLTEAIDRKHRQDRLREEWLEDEAAFELEQADRAQSGRR